MKEDQLIIRLTSAEKESHRVLADSLCIGMSDLSRMLFKLGRAKLSELEDQNRKIGLNAKELSVLSK